MRRWVVIAPLAAVLVFGCGKSSEETAREQGAREAAMQKALQASVEEEREKDRRMRESASTQADERIARENAAHEQELASAAAAGPTPDQIQADRVSQLNKYVSKLVMTLNDRSGVEFRRMSLSPKQNGMCAEFNARTKTGTYAGFKRAVVTDTRVAIEEPPLGDTLTQFLIFQIAARDTGCFPDVEKLQILQ